MDANTLRIILAVVGVLVFAGLYLWERRRSRRRNEDEYLEEDEAEERKREPRMGSWMADYENEASEQGLEAEAADRKGWSLSRFIKRAGAEPEPEQLELPQEPDQPELELEPPAGPPPAFPPGPMLLTLHIVSRGEPFDGTALVHAASRYGLEPGEMEIFHCLLGDDDHCQTLFSMANMVKPGTFPFGAMAEFTSPGVTLFSQLEGTPDDPGRMEEMLGTAHSLAEDLGGEIRDAKHRSLDAGAEQQLRDRVMAFVEWRLTHPAPA
jgi:cell division protein ZipA